MHESVQSAHYLDILIESDIQMFGLRKQLYDIQMFGLANNSTPAMM